MTWITTCLTAAACLLALPACRVVNQAARLPAEAVGVMAPGTKSAALDPADVQVQVQRYSDDFSMRTTAALDEYARRIATPEAEHQALRWKIAVNSASVSIATGPNPVANLLDFLAQATSARMALEKHATPTAQGAPLQPWLEASRILETNAWRLAASILTPDQQREAQDAIAAWVVSDSRVETTSFLRPVDFSALLRQGRQGRRDGQSPRSLFGLVGLDPTEGLEPAVREVTRARLLADRAMFMAQRMPFLLRWQVELLTDQLLDHDQVKGATESVRRLSLAAETSSQTIARLPDLVSSERAALVAELESQQGKLRELADSTARALEAGQGMSASLNTTLTTFDALMKRFGVGEPAPPRPDSPASTNATPFNILDYAQTAERITVLARELKAVFQGLTNTLDSPALDRRMQDVAALSERAKADARSVLNHAFLLGAALVVLSFACAVVYRRLLRPPARQSGPAPSRVHG